MKKTKLDLKQIKLCEDILYTLKFYPDIFDAMKEEDKKASYKALKENIDKIFGFEGEEDIITNRGFEIK
jgi:hypothetical protein